jgi:para-nitrobenzyl esterase
VLDGYFQIDQPSEIFAGGRQNDTPFMSGMNADETRYRGDTGDEFKELYSVRNEEEMTSALKLAGQEQSRLNTYLWLEYRAGTSGTNAYEYYFDRAIPWPDYPQFGAFHTAEVPYVFDNIQMLTTHHAIEMADSLIADRISSYWVNFVKTGDPNGPGLPVWESFDESRRDVMRLGEEMGMIPVAASDERYEFLKRQLLHTMK